MDHDASCLVKYIFCQFIIYILPIWFNHLYKFFSDRPRCSRNGEQLWFVGIQEEVEIPCQVEAFPKSPLNFTWTFVNNNSAFQDHAKMSILTRLIK